jgi:hypothetical protein
MSRSLDSLAPYFAPVAKSFVATLKERGVRCIVWDAGRTTAAQVALFAQGRETLAEVNRLRSIADMPPIDAADNTYTVTDCDGVTRKSRHQSLEALDIVVLDSKGRPAWNYINHSDEYKQIADIAAEFGLDSGARWMKRADGSPSPYASVGLGWDPPHHEKRRNA